MVKSGDTEWVEICTDAGDVGFVPAGTEIEDEKNLNGLGGWLVFIGLSLLVEPLIIIRAIASSGLDDTWLLINLAFLAGLLVLNILFFQKRKIFPVCYVIFIVLMFVAAVNQPTGVPFHTLSLGIERATQLMKQRQDEVYQQMGQITIYALIWIPYLLRSRRVKATFVR